MKIINAAFFRTYFLPILLSLPIFSWSQNSEIDSTKGLLWTASWSPDGKSIAVGGVQGALRFFSGEDYSLSKSLDFQNTITRLTWHPTEQKLIIGNQENGTEAYISILDLERDHFLELQDIPAGGARAITWNHDGSLLAVGDYEGDLYIFSKEGKLIRKKSIEPKGFTGVSWHPSKNIIACVGSQIAIYDVDADQVSIIEDRPVEILMLSVAWHPSGDFFVTGDYGDYEFSYPALLQFWMESGKQIRSISGSQAEYRNIYWNKDGSYLATASDALRIWSKEGELLHTGHSKHLLWGLSWSPDGQRIVTSSATGEIVIWDKEANRIQEISY